MFGLIQILFMTEKFKEISKDMFNFSHHKIHHFPFVCMLLNFVMIAIEALREGNLIEFCNKNNSIIVTMNEFFFGTVHYFFIKYKCEKNLMCDIGSMIQIINCFAKENVQQMLDINDAETIKLDTPN